MRATRLIPLGALVLLFVVMAVMFYFIGLRSGADFSAR